MNAKINKQNLILSSKKSNTYDDTHNTSQTPTASLKKNKFNEIFITYKFLYPQTTGQNFS